MGLNYTLSFPVQQDSPQQNHQQQQPSVSVADQQLQRRIIETDLAFRNSITRLNEIESYMRGLNEIRTALNYPSVKEGDAGLGDRPPLQAIFDEKIDAPRLRERYFTLLDRYLRYTEQFSVSMGTEPPKEAKQTEP